MARSTELKRLRERYRQCLRSAQNTASSLNYAIRDLQRLIANQGACYNVDDVKGGTKYVDYLLERVISIYSNLVNNVIPGTQAKISNLNWRINDALRKEALERSGGA